MTRPSTSTAGVGSPRVPLPAQLWLILPVTLCPARRWHYALTVIGGGRTVRTQANLLMVVLIPLRGPSGAE
jgi:hypothetical protein